MAQERAEKWDKENLNLYICAAVLIRFSEFNCTAGQNSATFCNFDRVCSIINSWKYLILLLDLLDNPQCPTEKRAILNTTGPELWS